MSYSCEACGFATPKWMGFCPQCRVDGALVEVSAARRSAPAAPARVVALGAGLSADLVRRTTGIGELDRVLGGGLVPGAAILIGGEPGVGKSTLLLQVAAAVATGGGRVLLASAEESPDQIGLRARRLGISGDGIRITADDDVDAIIAAAVGQDRPDLLIVDSVQTISAREVGGAAGGMAQVRECAARLIHTAKESGIPLVLIGHVTKDGDLAGPKLLEHTVDVVLHLEGDLDRGLRVLRGVKNRFGATHQVGLFEMGEEGMREVTDPAGLLATGHLGEVPGSVVFPAVDGRRPLLVEVQALVAATTNPQPRRSVKGLEVARVHQVLAVLERHVGLAFGSHDVYVSVVGGLRLRDPGADLPVAIALASSLLDRSVGAVAAWGEVGLTGEVRPVPHGEHRASEAKRLGLDAAIGPRGNGHDRIERVLGELGLKKSRVMSHQLG